jgi:hypothetical protein
MVTCQLLLHLSLEAVGAVDTPLVPLLFSWDPRRKLPMTSLDIDIHVLGLRKPPGRFNRQQAIPEIFRSQLTEFLKSPPTSEAQLEINLRLQFANTFTTWSRTVFLVL